MKNLKMSSVICGGILSLATSGLLAQTSTSPSSSSPSSSSTSDNSNLNQSSSSSSALGSSASSSTLAAQSGTMAMGSNVRLSQLLNNPVQSQDGKTLGYLRDVTVDPQSGRIEFGILSLSSAGAATDTSTSGRETTPSSRSSISGVPGSTSAYGQTGKLIPVPWQLFSQGWSGRHTGVSGTTSSTTSSTMGHNLVLNIDESKLRSAPSFEANNWNELQGGSFDQRAYSYFGVDRTSATGTSGSSLSGHGASGSHYGSGSHNQGSSTSPNSSSQGNSSTTTTPQR